MRRSYHITNVSSNLFPFFSQSIGKKDLSHLYIYTYKHCLDLGLFFTK